MRTRDVKFIRKIQVFKMKENRILLKPIGTTEEPHGHKGAVKVRPLNSGSDSFADLKSAYLVDNKNNGIAKEIYEVKKYRRGRFLFKFKDLKWRSDVEGYRNFVIAVSI